MPFGREPDRLAPSTASSAADEAGLNGRARRRGVAAGLAPMTSPADVPSSDGTDVPPEGGASAGAGTPRWIGPYRVLEKIGDGGMGSVFVAEQRESVRRGCAVKVVKPGMETGEMLRLSRAHAAAAEHATVDGRRSGDRDRP